MAENLMRKKKRMHDFSFDHFQFTASSQIPHFRSNAETSKKCIIRFILGYIINNFDTCAWVWALCNGHQCLMLDVLLTMASYNPPSILLHILCAIEILDGEKEMGCIQIPFIEVDLRSHTEQYMCSPLPVYVGGWDGYTHIHTHTKYRFVPFRSTIIIDGVYLMWSTIIMKPIITSKTKRRQSLSTRNNMLNELEKCASRMYWSFA